MTHLDDTRAAQLDEFVLARLEEDEERVRAGELPLLDEAERRGRLRIMYADDGDGLLLAGGPVEAMEDRHPVPFAEKAEFLRREIRDAHDDTSVKLIASVYEAHPDWQDDWRP
ncbi:hypothetical protein H4696_000837 [Amycolatopsis lexingtonensis]|uniref:Uncharacterized protein n=1 Tax=Amycolatopsis lexingtonensis TaxID=218822 RepID=A0ABR9HS29_9PSEU|nr:hypothetical protein [Amycolatopsis lexingtonensis]MBE1493737.1 hypothetical protein [Amycolatopsis lexingtonensis]